MADVPQVYEYDRLMARIQADLVWCDMPDCQAKQKPETADEIRQAYEHWRWHVNDSGCSHGRWRNYK